MIVVADTGPLNYLVLIGYIDLLPVLYGEVIIPPAVQDELLDTLAPASVRSWMSNPPPWLEVRSPERADPRLTQDLDEGETEAITLAQNMSGEVLLAIDERRGRKEAERLGLNIVGTLGILDAAHRRGLIDICVAIESLRRTSFQATDSLYRDFLDQA